ncbi:MAG: glycosyltransferase [Caldilineaceae bacterium]|nr:glycosyltransferase [Caldilineaceae bacterium]
MKRRITLVCGSWPPMRCGVGDFSYRLASELSISGNQVSVVTDQRARREDRPTINVFPVISQWGPTALWRVFSAIKKTDPDVVNLQYPTVRYPRFSLVDLLPIVLRRFLHKPVVTTLHEYSTFRALGRFRVESLARGSTAVIIPDVQNHMLLSASLPTIRDRMHYIPLGSSIIPPEDSEFDRDAWRQAHGLSPNTLMLVYFGFISPSKGVDIMLQAISQLPATLPVHLWLLADQEPSAPQYTAYHLKIAAQIEVFSKRYPITWTGYLPTSSVSEHLLAADLAVLPFTDGASLRRSSLLACIAHGLPVLSTGNYSPCPGVTVVPVGDVTALAQAALDLGARPHTLALLRQQATQTATQLSWPAIAKKTSSCFSQYISH